MQKSAAKVLGFFLLAAVLLRIGTLFRTVINHDESTYIVISDHILAGQLYFVDMIDTKPIGVFLIYALLQKIVGGSMFALRLMPALWLGITAYLLYRAHLSWGQSARVGIASGIIYLFLNSIFTFYGLSPNTETWFNGFTALALWMVLQGGAWWRYGLAGLALGIGMVIKQVVVFDALALGLFVLWSQQWRLIAWKSGILMAVISLLPLGLVMGYYQLQGHLDTFLFYTFELSSRYPVVAPIQDYFIQPLDFFLRFLPVSFFFFFAIAKNRHQPLLRKLAWLWPLLVLLAILIPGKFFGHYFVQFMLPFSFIAGLFFGCAQKDYPRWTKVILRPKVGFTLLALLFAVNLFLQVQDNILKPDPGREIADYLEPRLQEGDAIYASSGQQIQYHLHGRLSPLTYVHPSLFWEQKHIKALEVDVAAELNKLQAAAPAYIILQTDLPDDRLDDFLSSQYLPDREIGKYRIYRRR